MRDPVSERLGPPDLRIAGLRLWVHGREFEDSDDFWDGNWLRVTARCEAPGARVEASGPILRVPELRGWAEECADLHATGHGSAGLHCIEPDLSVEMRCNHLGHIALEVRITPDPLTQEHSFSFEIDQSYLPDLVRDLSKILARYPVRSAEEA